MVQYLHFRILEFPLNLGGYSSYTKYHGDGIWNTMIETWFTMVIIWLRYGYDMVMIWL